MSLTGKVARDARIKKKHHHVIRVVLLDTVGR